MLSSHRRPVALALVVGVAVGAGAVGVVGAVSAPTAKRELLGATRDAIGASGRTLGLSRVTIPAGVRLPPHHHEGTQVVMIDHGKLTYTVTAGRVSVMRGLADGPPKVVRTIAAGQTGVLVKGYWFVEQPSVVHYAEAVSRTVVIQATLLKNGAPAATVEGG